MTRVVDKTACGWYNETVMNRGKFIVFEGIDGSGKSTQLKMLSKYLQGKGIPCVTTCEPTDSPFGGLLRACLTGRLETDERAIAALFAADRMDHLFNPINGIEKRLNEGVTVLCDRYYFSSLAYNGEMTDSVWVEELNRPAMEQMRPDLVIYIELTAEAGMERVGKRSERERYETLEKQKKIRERYLRVFEKRAAQESIAVIKSERDKERTQEKIRAAVNGLFGI